MRTTCFLLTAFLVFTYMVPAQDHGLPEGPFEARIASARRLIVEGRMREAAKLLEEAANREPDNAIVHNDLGIAHFGEGDLASAIRAFRSALRANPDLSEARRNLASALYRDGDSEGAIRELRVIVKQNPQDAMALNDLAVVLSSSGKLDDAIETAEAAFALLPSNPVILCNLGMFFLEANAPRKALPLLKKALQIKSDYPEARYALALAYLSVNYRLASLREYSILKSEDEVLAAALLQLIFARKVLSATAKQ